jgi:gluconokinase
MSDAARDPAPLTLVVMGVSGVGKTSVAHALVERTGWAFQEGDDLHPDANRAKMAAGTPLTDDDRWPWLRLIAAWIGEQEAAGHGAVVTCSALRRSYRDLLSDGHPSVRFVHLQASEGVLTERVTGRHHEYMPPALLRSQLETLEPLADDEPGVGVETDGGPDAVADRALERLADEA